MKSGSKWSRRASKECKKKPKRGRTRRTRTKRLGRAPPTTHATLRWKHACACESTPLSHRFPARHLPTSSPKVFLFLFVCVCVLCLPVFGCVSNLGSKKYGERLRFHRRKPPTHIISTHRAELFFPRLNAVL